MSNLTESPCWRPEDLGTPIPNSVHATSVAMPLWQDVVGYEEGESRVVGSLQSGYPRFKIHDAVLALESTFHQKQDWRALAFPSKKVAQRCLDFIAKQAPDVKAEILENGTYDAVSVPSEHYRLVLDYWQHCGEIISSRQALSATVDPNRGGAAKQELKGFLAHISGGNQEEVYLYPTGMAAIAAAFRVVTHIRSNLPTVQFGFPYVDSLKIQQKLGVGVHFFPHGTPEDAAQTIQLAKEGKIAAVFCECPTNPLLRVPELENFYQDLKAAGVPLIVDNSLDSFDNLDLLPHADIVVTSLTKFISGKGDVMGGSLILNPESTLDLAAALNDDFEDLLFAEDAIVLNENARGFQARMRDINRNTAALIDVLRNSQLTDQVYYPDTNPNYHALRRPGRVGAGGMLSITFKNPELDAAQFYNVLKVSKGPSLGTEFSLVCPYTLLAHYHELPWAEEQGISANLIRISVGVEPQVVQTFREALDCLHPATTN